MNSAKVYSDFISDVTSTVMHSLGSPCDITCTRTHTHTQIVVASLNN